MRSGSRLAALAALCLGLSLAGCNGGNKCTQNADCGSGLVCGASGSCVKPGQCDVGVETCTNAAQCASGQTCSSGCCAAVAGCATSLDCTNSSQPHCDASTHTCVACSSNADCLGGHICAATGSCEAACDPNKGGTDCPASKNKCRASPNGSYCAECSASADCPSDRPTCTVAGVCFGCASNAECSADAPACNTTTHVCSACNDTDNRNGKNAQCPASKPACQSHACVVCNPTVNAGDSSNGACPTTTPACLSNNTCAQCDPAKNAANKSNSLCGLAAPYCDPTSKACVRCIDATQCSAGEICGTDHACHAPAASAVCLSSTSTCPSTATVAIGSTLNVAAKLDTLATAPTTVSFTLTAGAASFAQGSALATATAQVPTGSDTTPLVPLYLSAADSQDVVVQATAGGVSKTATIHITLVPAALSTFTSDKQHVQEGGSATLTVTLDSTPTSNAVVALTNDDAPFGSLSAASTTVLAGDTSATAGFMATALASGTAHLHASYSGVTKDLSVDVFKVQVTNLTAASSTIAPSGTMQLTVTVDAAPPASAVVALGASGAGTVPATVTVPAGQTTASFTFTAGSNEGGATVTATAGGASKNIDITVTKPPVKVMVVRVDGQDTLGNSVALSSAAAKVVLEEYNVTTSTKLREIGLPTAASGGNQALVMSGSSTTEGALSRSADGKLVVMGGYAAAPGLATVATTLATATPRIVGSVDANATIDTSTQITSAFGCATTNGSCSGAGNIRAATSADGSAFWAVGSNSGVVYVTKGSSGATTTVSTTFSNLRQVHIFGNQLYIGSGISALAGIAAVGTGLPTTTSTTATTFFVESASSFSPESFSLFDLDATTGPELGYLADTGNGVADILNVGRWTLSGTWSKDSAFKPALTGLANTVGVVGLAAVQDGTSIRIIASTTDGKLVTFLDDGVNKTPTVTVIATATATANSAYRGVALSPNP